MGNLHNLGNEDLHPSLVSAANLVEKKLGKLGSSKIINDKNKDEVIQLITSKRKVKKI
jgi:hypothetical protein